MDILTLVVLMAVLYLVPELMRKKKKVKYEYPMPQQAQQSVPQEKQKVVNKLELPETSTFAVMPVAPAMATEAIKAEPSAWKNLDKATVVNGFIFSQILEPPRACRPFYYKKRC